MGKRFFPVLFFCSPDCYDFMWRGKEYISFENEWINFLFNSRRYNFSNEIEKLHKKNYF